MHSESTTSKLRQMLEEPVAIGAPRTFWQDAYFRFMHASWPTVFAFFILTYLCLNLLFALAYWVAPGSVANARPDSFADHFFFSIQTFATIGYGVFYPASLAGHILVTLEAGLGLISVAMATGVMFAKLSKPKAFVLFSDNMVITTREGIPTLSFRVANARANDVVEAYIRVVMLVSEESSEGHRMRRVIDIPLVRDNSPYFRLSWTVMHVLDEKSPLRACDLLTKTPTHLVSFVVTLTGHDGTYGQTIYARKLYSPSDVKLHHRFVDVLSELPDGRTQIDFRKFHETIPDPKSELRS